MRAQARQAADALFRRPGHGLQLDDFPVAQAIGDEKFDGHLVPGEQMAERELRPLLAGVKVHVDLDENQLALLQHILGAHHLADAVVRPVEKRFERRLALVVPAASGKNDLLGKETFDQSRIVAGVEQRDVVIVVQHVLRPSADRLDAHVLRDSPGNL